MSRYALDALAALGLALVVSVALGPLLIPFLARLKAGQVIRTDGPASHLGKSGTPTMGGILIIIAIITASLILAGRNREVLLCLAATVAFGFMGFVDDYIKVVLRRSLGLRAREKLAMQVFFGTLICIYLVFGLSRGTDILVPFTGDTIAMGYWYFPFLILVFMSSTNAVNLTDGLDGLAAGSTFIVALGLAVVSLITSHPSLAVFSGGVAGACLGFLIFNRHPARIFMGDTGSMALGGAVAAVAAITKSELALIIIGGLYAIEALSVIIQVVSFQTTGKRIFKMAPLHHHFELSGWKEQKVVRCFWIICLLFVITGLISFIGMGY